MLKSLAITACFLASLAACSAGPAARKDTTAGVATATPSTCLTDTGSRLRPDPGHCAAFGRSYSREDIERTGHIDTGEALQALDPAITASH